MRAHVHGGDISAAAASEAGIEGDHFAFREALVDGPVVAGLPDEEWTEMRAEHLSSTYGEDLATMRRFWTEELAMIEDLLEREELFFWFDRDLFCQVNLMFLLARFAEEGYEGACTIVESHQGEEGALDHSIRHLSPEELDGYARAWNIYGSNRPEDLAKLLGGELPQSLRDALELHLQRFPSRHNGLGRPEQKLLELIAAADAMTFEELFVRFADIEAGYGLGDAQVWSLLRDLASSPESLIEIEELDEPLLSRITMTASGTAVLAGNEDAIALRGIDRWLGGVELTASNLWRYTGQGLEQEAPPAGAESRSEDRS